MSTSIKEVTAIMNAMAANMGNSVNAASDVSFESVWSNQANRNQTWEGTDRPIDTRKANPQDEALKAKETVRKPLKDATENTEKANGMTDKEAMEVLGTAANEMMQQVADTLGMSVEELKQLMEEMDMSVLELMNPQQLSALILKAAGVTDTMALLTNEALYGDFKQLMDKQQELLAEAGNQLQMSNEQLLAELEQLQKLDMNAATQDAFGQMTEEPVVEITVEADSSEETAVSEEDNDANLNTVGKALQGSEETLAVQKTEGGTQSGDSNRHADGSNEQSGNLVLQTMKAENAQPEVNTTYGNSAWNAETQDIMRQVMDYMRIQIKPDVSDVEMQLHPESLGRLQIHVSSKGGVVTANFITQNEAVKAALESQMVQLKENFAEQGVKVEAIEVTVQTQEFERNLDQGRGSNQSEPEKKGKNRRINLNALSGLEETEEMSQEDALVAEMMTANGNTVDFTA